MEEVEVILSPPEAAADPELDLSPAQLIDDDCSSPSVQVNSAPEDDDPADDSEDDTAGLNTSGDILKIKEVKPAVIWSHLRANCPVHQFAKLKGTWSLTAVHKANEVFCDKCFCYVCDVQ